MTTNIGNLNSFSYSNIANASSSVISDKLYVPVNPSALLYSHLDHVQGVAAKPGQHGVSISKIYILNSLIEHVADIKNEQNFTKFDEFLSKHDMSDAQIDSLIKDFHSQIQKAMQTPYILSGARPMAGDLFSINA
ncbi:MAG: hypothetical protein IKX23_07305 [Treponema sp.]|nr:hypothetical protein [Treponema sp.]